MKIYARIENGIVAEIIPPLFDEDGTEHAIDTRFTPDVAATIVDASMAPGVAQGWTYSGGVFYATVVAARPLADVKAEKLAELSAACSACMDVVKGGYPPEEIQSWPKQEGEARAYVASSTAATPLLLAIASERGITLDDLVARVIAKADAFAAESGKIIGRRQKYADAVNAAPDVAAVSAIVWSS